MCVCVQMASLCGDNLEQQHVGDKYDLKKPDPPTPPSLTDPSRTPHWGGESVLRGWVEGLGGAEGQAVQTRENVVKQKAARKHK